MYLCSIVTLTCYRKIIINGVVNKVIAAIYSKDYKLQNVVCSLLIMI